MFRAVVSYTAKGANRHDIKRRLESKVPAEYVHVESTAEIKKLG
jgi:hypothetical protein